MDHFTPHEDLLDVKLRDLLFFLLIFEHRKLIDAARQLVEREKGGNYLSPDEIPSLLDPELPQQLLVSAFRRYRR